MHKLDHTGRQAVSDLTFGGVILVACIAAISVLAAVDAERSEVERWTEYCRQVYAGKWPDYLNRYDVKCTPKGKVKR